MTLRQYGNFELTCAHNTRLDRVRENVEFSGISPQESLVLDICPIQIYLSCGDAETKLLQMKAGADLDCSVHQDGLSSNYGPILLSIRFLI